MTTLELKYNPFAVKTDFFINGKEASLKCFGTGDKIRLRDYINDFFPEAIKKSNVGPGEECIMQFYGTQDAFEDVRKSFDDYISQAAEGMKIELLEYKPYPNNFNEMNLLIAKKRKNYTEQIEHKNKILKNPMEGKNNIAISDVEKRFDKDKKAITQIFDENLEKAKSVMEKAKEEFSFSTINVGNIIHSVGGIPLFPGYELNPALRVMATFSLAQKVTSLETNKVKEKYDENIKTIKSAYAKSCEELTDLFISLYEKLENALRSEVETILRDYTALHSDSLISNYILQKNRQKNAFDINKTIPASCFSSMQINETSSTVRIGIALINETIEKVASSCQEYFNSIFEAAKQAFLDETEKCKAYYLEQLQELQKTLKEKLSSTKQIEQEILIIKAKIECLDELQNEINRLITG